MTLLAAIVSEPGERTSATLARELGLPLRAVRASIRSLRRRGLVEPSCCRIVPHRSGTGLVKPGLAETEMARRVWAALVAGDGSDVAHSRPLSRRALASKLDVSVGCGRFKKALRELHSFGSLSLSTDVWPSAAGIALHTKGESPTEGGSDAA